MNSTRSLNSAEPRPLGSALNSAVPRPIGSGRIPIAVVLIAVMAQPIALSADKLTGFPFQSETLVYSVNWPSGLSLGEATVTASRSDTRWNFGLALSVGIPGFPIADKYRSSAAAADLCSTELRRDIGHGNKKVVEKTTFDQAKGTAQRQTLTPDGGGKSDLSFHGCGRDALAFWFFARRELGQGRVPPQETVFFGSGYSARLDYTGAMTVPVADKPTVTDHLVAHVKGPASDFSFEVFYARDAARTPLLIKIPVSVGTISLELVR
jgi:hypothetical protein